MVPGLSSFPIVAFCLSCRLAACFGYGSDQFSMSVMSYITPDTPGSFHRCRPLAANLMVEYNSMVPGFRGGGLRQAH